MAKAPRFNDFDDFVCPNETVTGKFSRKDEQQFIFIWFEIKN